MERPGPPLRLLGWTAALLGAVLAASAVSLLWAALAVPRPTVFDVNALTERIEFAPGPGPRSRWVLEDALLFEPGMDSARTFTGSFELADSTTVILERVALGPLWIQVRAAREGSSAGTLYSEADEMLATTADRVDFEIRDLPGRAAQGRTIVLPLRGTVATGRPIAFETGGTSAALRSGRVSLLAASFFGSTTFAAGEIELEAGDEFQVVDPQGLAHGVVLGDERPALTAAYRIQGRNGLIIRPGGGEYPVSISFLDRALHDPLFRALSLLMGLLVGLATVLTFFVTAWQAWPARLDALRGAPGRRREESSEPTSSEESAEPTSREVSPEPNLTGGPRKTTSREEPQAPTSREESPEPVSPEDPSEPTSRGESSEPDSRGEPSPTEESHEPTSRGEPSEPTPTDEPREPTSPASEGIGRKGTAPLAILTCLACAGVATPLHARSSVQGQRVVDPEVWVQGATIGQGTLRARGRDCVVVTPHHVIGDEPPVFILVIGADGLTTRGTVAASYQPDLAVVMLDESNPFPCGSWRTGFDAYDELRGGRSADLRIREEDGSLSLVPVSIRSVQREYVLVRAVGPETPIMQTMSGATLMVENRPMGMLLRLLETGEGEVYQIDDVQRRTQPYFDVVSERSVPEVELDLPTALSLMDRAMEARDGSSQGQDRAIETLLALGHQYEGTDLGGISFRDANLTGGTFSGADLSASDLGGTDGADLRLDEGRLAFARMDGVSWPNASLSAVFGPFLSAPGAELPGAVLAGANLAGADLRNADLRDADLRGAALAFADLRGARLDGADLSGAYLMGAVLDSATFEGATVAETDLTAAVAAEAPFSAEQAAGACSHGGFNGSWFHWTVEVIEAWDSDRYATGREYDDAIRVADGFEAFPIYEHRACESPDDAARGFYAGSEPHHIRIGVERTYFARAGRRAEFRQRIEGHFQLLTDRLVEARKAVR